MLKKKMVNKEKCSKKFQNNLQKEDNELDDYKYKLHGISAQSKYCNLMGKDWLEINGYSESIKNITDTLSFENDFDMWYDEEQNVVFIYIQDSDNLRPRGFYKFKKLYFIRPFDYYDYGKVRIKTLACWKNHWTCIKDSIWRRFEKVYNEDKNPEIEIISTNNSSVFSQFFAFDINQKYPRAYIVQTMFAGKGAFKYIKSKNDNSKYCTNNYMSKFNTYRSVNYVHKNDSNFEKGFNNPITIEKIGNFNFFKWEFFGNFFHNSYREKRYYEEKIYNKASKNLTKKFIGLFKDFSKTLDKCNYTSISSGLHEVAWKLMCISNKEEPYNCDWLKTEIGKAYINWRDTKLKNISTNKKAASKERLLLVNLQLSLEDYLYNNKLILKEIELGTLDNDEYNSLINSMHNLVMQMISDIKKTIKGSSNLDYYVFNKNNKVLYRKDNKYYFDDFKKPNEIWNLDSGWKVHYDDESMLKWQLKIIKGKNPDLDLSNIKISL